MSSCSAISIASRPGRRQGRKSRVVPPKDRTFPLTLQWEGGGMERRIDRLLDAVVAVSGDLDLQAVLHRIAEAAASLVDAEYAALGVISEDGLALAQFLVVGVDDEMVARIGNLPAGHGVLGKLITDPRPPRL